MEKENRKKIKEDVFKSNFGKKIQMKNKTFSNRPF